MRIFQWFVLMVCEASVPVASSAVFLAATCRHRRTVRRTRVLEKDGEILMHILHAVVLNEGDRTVTSLAISPPSFYLSQSPFMRQEARDESAGSRQGCPW